MKIGLKSRYAYLHLILSLLPDSQSPEAKRAMIELGTWIDTTSDSEFQTKATHLTGLLDQMLAAAHKRLPPKLDWQQIAAEHWQRCTTKDFSFSTGTSYGWLVERFDCGSLHIPSDMPYHAHIGVGPHAGHAAIEEDFLLRDAFFLLSRCTKSLVYLESFRGKAQSDNDAKKLYRQISTANQNVATYARFTVSGFYAFVECFVNSVGEDFVLRNPTVSDAAKGLLRGKKDGRYLSIEKKIELFPGLIRPDGKRPLVLSDPQQIAEPYNAFVSHIKDVRDASAHYAKSKADILMSPQTWNKNANEAAAVCVAVARGFWTACYPNRSLPLYLGKLDNAQHLKLAEARIEAELVAHQETHSSNKT